MAKNAAIGAASYAAGYVAVNVAAGAAANHIPKSKYEKVAAKTQKRQAKAHKKRYAQDKKMSTGARKSNLAKAGMNYNGTLKGTRKGAKRRRTTKVTSHRLPGQAMIGSR